MTARERRRLASELRGVRLIGGGRGCVFLCTPRRLIISTAACEALEQAAARRGYGKGWGGVVNALAKKALRGVIDEAVRATEASRA